MRYTVSDLYTAIGCHWVSNNDFEYPLNPNLRYTMATVNTMRAEWQYRRSKNMPIDTPQLLQRALHNIREEVNRMSMRLNRYHFCQLAIERIEHGLMHEA
ncbi:hypothetical protein ACSBR1_029866 [Camellia fascicularis]